MSSHSGAVRIATDRRVEAPLQTCWMWDGSKDGSGALSEALMFVREATPGGVARAEVEPAVRGESRTALAGVPAMGSSESRNR